MAEPDAGAHSNRVAAGEHAFALDGGP